MPKVYNRRNPSTIPAGAVYVGRGTPWGNPFVIGTHGTREVVIAKFTRYAHKRLELEPEWLDSLRGKDIVCWCAPEPCHADVLLRLANELD